MVCKTCAYYEDDGVCVLYGYYVEHTPLHCYDYLEVEDEG